MSELAYLVIREGSKWTDVFRLVPGESVTIGRAPTNQIMLKDERCSRNHAELFLSEGHWTLRDLDSRNGTVVGEQLLKGDWVLRPGDVVRIGRSQLVFVYNLSEAFSDAGTVVRRPVVPSDKTADSRARDEASVLETYDPTTITHRRGQTRFLESAVEEQDESGISRMGRAAAKLCRLAFELGKAPDAAKMADLALVALFEGIEIDAGALLLLPRGFEGEPTGSDLETVASHTASERRYHRVATFLATTVMREGEAVLARNVMGDSSLGSRDSKGVIHTTSVICAPVRQGDAVLGLIHLYSTDPDCVPDPEDLEYTLAVADTVAVALTNLIRREDLAENLTQVRDENEQLRERLGVQSEIVGGSASVKEINEEIARAAASKATLLIRGESGVGKELVARGVHFSSPRRKNVFVCLNCAALSEELLASELFGHERGAFTGATDRKIGKFEAAHQGTLMLDEIGEMSLGIQTKFLRVLEGHPFERVGGNKPVKVDVRVIAATNRDLERDVAEGRFRHDLFFRLRVLEIVVPPLRKRAEDIPELADYFLSKFRAETGRKIQGFSPKAMEQLNSYRWPGNIRELKNVVERAVVLCRGRHIEEEDLVLTSLSTTGDTAETKQPSDQFTPCSLSDVERRHILATLNHTGWNKSRTASILGIERSTLDRKIRRYSLAEEHAPVRPRVAEQQ
ncbi:MAG TPA: sigma 54-interacting transcriptional regulator [Thermoguttaceae bacterium]|nr:sigma 54-interacting transcriptional regulator [Thermoguttaceae bacterium]